MGAAIRALGDRGVGEADIKSRRSARIDDQRLDVGIAAGRRREAVDGSKGDASIRAFKQSPGREVKATLIEREHSSVDGRSLHGIDHKQPKRDTGTDAGPLAAAVGCFERRAAAEDRCKRSRRGRKIIRGGRACDVGIPRRIDGNTAG